MSTKALALTITGEISEVVSQIDDNECLNIEKRIVAAKRIFITAAGRSMLVMRMFAMRLMHMGLSVFLVGDTTTPAITSDDILIIGSGSGETKNQIAIAEKAKQMGATVCSILGNDKSSLAKISDAKLYIPVNSPNLKIKSVQPAGNLFEQSMCVALESIIMSISQAIHFDLTAKSKYHANLE
jgi:6-phospho-3-hexuloisomerase